MKYSDIEVGAELYHEKSNRDWQDRKGYGRRVTVLDTTRHSQSSGYRRDVRPDPSGNLIKVRFHGNPTSRFNYEREDRDDYVTLISLRGPWAELHAEDQQVAAERDAERKREQETRQQSAALVDRVKSKAAALGLDIRNARVPVVSASRVHAELTIDAGGLEVWLDKLIAEAGDAELPDDLPYGS